MENHPIPQDVTGFKFKLIGSITVKQFLYLMGFGIMTTVCFVAFQKTPLIMIPSMLMFIVTGLALTFVPIEGRPMDLMIKNFVKTIPSENRYIFKKRGAAISSFEALKIPVVKKASTVAAPVKTTYQQNDDKRAMLLSRLRNSPFRPDEGELEHLKSIKSFFDETAGNTPTIIHPVAETIQIKPAPKIIAADEISDDATTKQEHIDELQKQVEADQIKKAAEQAHEKKEQPVQETARVEQQPNIKTVDEEKDTKSIPSITPVATNPTMVASPTLAGGFPALPDIGNVVMGIVRDPRGKSLQNILVEVLDKNGLPVRAFKTNALGQFSSATPLPNGDYKMVFEDAQKHHEFEPMEVSMTGAIFIPIEAVSIDSREKLRRELFGGSVAAPAQ